MKKRTKKIFSVGLTLCMIFSVMVKPVFAFKKNYIDAPQIDIVLPTSDMEIKDLKVTTDSEDYYLYGPSVSEITEQGPFSPNGWYKVGRTYQTTFTIHIKNTNKNRFTETPSTKNITVTGVGDIALTYEDSLTLKLKITHFVNDKVQKADYKAVYEFQDTLTEQGFKTKKTVTLNSIVGSIPKVPELSPEEVGPYYYYKGMKNRTPLAADGSSVYHAQYFLKVLNLVYYPSEEFGGTQIEQKITHDNVFTARIPEFNGTYDKTKYEFDYWQAEFNGLSFSLIPNQTTETLDSLFVNVINTQNVYIHPHFKTLDTTVNTEKVNEISYDQESDLSLSYTSTGEAVPTAVTINSEAVPEDYVNINGINVKIAKEFFDGKAAGTYTVHMTMSKGNDLTFKVQLARKTYYIRTKLIGDGKADWSCEINGETDGLYTPVGDETAYPVTYGDTVSFIVYPHKDNELVKICKGNDVLSEEVTYTFTVTGNEVFDCYVNKIVPTATVDQPVIDFGTVLDSYSPIKEKSFVVTNNSKLDYYVLQPVSEHYIISDLVGENVNKVEFAGMICYYLPQGASGTFTVQPKDGLPVGQYNEVLKIYKADYVAPLVVNEEEPEDIVLTSVQLKFNVKDEKVDIPTKPETDNKKPNEVEKEDKVQTSDMTSILPWATLLLGSMGAVVTLRKKEQE